MDTGDETAALWVVAAMFVAMFVLSLLNIRGCLHG